MTDGADVTTPGDEDHGERREDKRIVDPETGIPESQLSESAQREAPSEAPMDQRSLRALYEARLELIWAAAHSQTQSDDREWRAFREAMLDVADVVPLVGDQAALMVDVGTPLDGNLDTVELLVADEVARQPDPQALAAFVRNRLAPTIDRLQQTEEGTPERRVDVVVRALSALRGTPPAADLACELLRYLQNQDPAERQAGFYITVANLVMTVSAAGDDFRRVEAAFMYHMVLDGFRSLAAQGSLRELNEPNTSAVSNSAFNVSTDVSALLRRRREDSSEQGIDVLRDLKTISASTARLIDVEEAPAAVVVYALGFTTDRAREFLTVLLNLGSLARAWEETPTGLARLEASSGVADAVRATPEYFAARLFNAGVSLIRAQADDLAPVILSRLLLNALGLRLALQLDSDLVTALVGLDSLDCAVNFVGAFVEYQRMADPSVARGVEPLVRQLVDLPRWPPLRATGPGPGVALARLTSAGERLGMTPTERVSFPGLPASLNDALDALRAAAHAPAAKGDVFLDAAQLVGHLFTAVLPPTADSSGQQQTIDTVLASRDQPVGTLIARYASYASSPDDPVGDGPLVAAGVLERAEWDRVARRLLKPLESIVPALRDFSL
ncbi:MAG: hypothetical protein ACRDZ4_22240 [Egibacteraceae bacterium]